MTNKELRICKSGERDKICLFSRNEELGEVGKG